MGLFSENGVSIVKVGSTGLFRYSRILQRKDETIVPIRVACLADRDILPDSAKALDIGDKRKVQSGYSEIEITDKVNRLKRNDGGSVRTFVSPQWTLEYDLALSGLAREVYIAVTLAEKSRSSGVLSQDQKNSAMEEAVTEYEKWTGSGLGSEEIAVKVYSPLFERNVSKAETAQFLAEYLDSVRPTAEAMRASLPEYLVEAINYVTRQDDSTD